MHKLLLFLFLLPLAATAQRDFDYTFYTANVRIEPDSTNKKDTLRDYPAFRIIKKEGTILTIGYPPATGNSQTWLAYFVGYNPEEQAFIYESKFIYGDQMVIHISVNPVMGVVKMYYTGRTEIYY